MIGCTLASIAKPCDVSQSGSALGTLACSVTVSYGPTVPSWTTVPLRSTRTEAGLITRVRIREAEYLTGLAASHGGDVAVLAPPTDDDHAAVLALLADGEAWSSSALALALGTSQRTVQRALDAHLSGQKSYGFELWGLMVLSAWHRRYIRQPVTAPGGPLPRSIDVATCAA